MYNRYIRSGDGGYTRVQQEDPPSQERSPPPHPPAADESNESNCGSRTGPPRFSDGLSGFLRHLLDQFHLDSVDTGDLLLLVLLYFLFRENADEELLVALGLLLIL
ncbi:hypothetical protein [uncultured Dysosmobacter sp.]|uniref:hypothetical protein n=1 Tax=uncultured Dysosmobacter sp. TaxID=2591384 RepID=UPI002633B396|nr:hypothetical protein [uncultured Dysosmobacter sp.]